MRGTRGKEEGQVLAAGTHGVGRKRRGTATDRRSSGEQICEPGGGMERDFGGKERGDDGLHIAVLGRADLGLNGTN